ncbi:GAF and ANTAR domain-containing protein [Streptomyces sp. V4-01]|uniref:GAF and ANTAR domain-containing protein n=1 Tax=Actinacidiphila polyblastidii TaxID=3110430 RepID=A0ABU7PG65_9ACTN|nr:GAF and ANTAR domain-containing protein [Streptomyces sp. V4-01]
MARELLAQRSVDDTVAHITRSAITLVPGCDASGILVLDGGRAQTLAPTEKLVVDSDRLQARTKQGPCFEAARFKGTKQVYRIGDLGSERERWQTFSPQAHALGVGSMMGFLLFTEDEDFGALNFYSRTPGAFTEASETAGVLLASHAAVALSSARTHAQLSQAMTTRHLIGEAIGILMGARRLTEQQAFDVLRRYSQERNIKLREVAARVREQGSLD